MAFLQEFSKMVILRDTPDTRWAFGPPINETSILNAAIGAQDDNANPFYKRLRGKSSPDSNFRGGWRGGYPNIDNSLLPGTNEDGSGYTDASGTYILGTDWTTRLRNNILQTIGVEQNNQEGYDKLTPEDSGTAIIVNNKFYIGGSEVTYSAISTSGGEVVVSGVVGGTVAVGSKVVLSNVGTTTLSTSTIYYAYASNSTSFKLSETSGTNPIDDATGSFSGSAIASVAGGLHIYTNKTTFVSPTPALAVGDFIFWGVDPNGLKIGGKIAQVYSVGSADYNTGARYRFEKNTTQAFPLDGEGDPIPQNIYYYRNTWNGKGIKNVTQVNPNVDVGGGFYLLIKGVRNGNAITYPYLGYDTARNGDTADDDPEKRVIRRFSPDNPYCYAFTDLIRIRKISNRFRSDETVNNNEAGDIIPCTIHRTNNFFYTNSAGQGYSQDYVESTGVLSSLYGGGFYGGFSDWVAYYINPYGGSTDKLDKNTTYILEVNERLPAANFTNGTDMFNFAKSGAI